MTWRRVAWAGCLAPLFGGGCNIAYYAARNVVNEPVQACDNVSRTGHLRKQARVAWREVREQFPRKAFTAEFRDGFLDGFVDYLDRGGNAQPPVVPPRRYTRNDYLTPEGHLLIKDYFLGFRYGLDVAVASGRRQFLVVPVLLPEQAAGPVAFNVQPGADPDGATPLHPPRALPVPAAPPPALPAAPPPGGPTVPPGGPAMPPAPGAPTPPRATGSRPEPAPPVGVPKLTALPKPVGSPFREPVGSKFSDGPVAPLPPEPATEPANLLPRPNPPLPIPRPVAEPSAGPGGKFDGPPAGVDGTFDPPPGRPPVATPVALPAPPTEVPDLPAHVPTPSILDDLPSVPANHLIPPPKPLATDIPPSR